MYPQHGMSSFSTVFSEDEFLCSLCLDVFKKPVTTPCGHNFCMACINEYWRTTLMCQCPLCKHKFPKIPELKVNTFISEMVAKFWCSAQGNDTNPLMQVAAKPGAGEVNCDFCIGGKVKAIKSCPDCQASYCETHLEPHKKVTALKKHKLINPVGNLEERLCKSHDRPLELFCKTDQTYVCQFCTETDHNAHNIGSLVDESRDMKAQLEKMDVEMKQMIQGRLQKVKEIKGTVQSNKINAEKEIKACWQVFRELMCSIERSQGELIEVIEEKQKAAERRAEGLIKELETEITELKQRHSKLEQLSHTRDYFHLLQSFPSLCNALPTKDWSEIRIQSLEYIGTVRKAVSRAGSQFEETLNKEVKRLCDAELKMIQQWSVDVTLDLDTAHPNLLLSEDAKQTRHAGRRQNLPDNPERFFYISSVLGKESFSSGRFYYEVDVKGNTLWSVGVARESINRKIHAAKPENGLWSVQLGKGNVYQACTTDPTPLSLSKKPQTIGVYVDYEEGEVSLYDAHTRSHIYLFTGCTFTDKLCPYFNLGVCGIDKMSEPLTISPV